ncbi:membrane protein [Gordonia phage Magel]|uniref:Membrane protein n=1 Tax=Gordonia phage Magel TaxID=2743986 RepID=A0A7D5FKP8_9CAUD|nr:membrane protein [Gordonia phage Magel]
MKGITMESPTSSIINGFASMTFPALLAVILLVGLLMFASAMFVMHIQATQSRAHVKHARRRFQNNSEKEDFFDMVTRFHDEIPA